MFKMGENICLYKTHKRMFKAVLSIKGENWKQPKGLLSGEKERKYGLSILWNIIRQ